MFTDDCVSHIGYRILHFLIRQSALSILHNYPESKAFLVFGKPWSTVLVEHAEGLDERGGRLPQGVQHLACKDVFGDDKSQITSHLRESRKRNMTWQNPPRNSLTVNLKQHWRRGQIKGLRQRRVQRAEPADSLTIQ